jgi:hypothetical protein
MQEDRHFPFLVFEDDDDPIWKMTDLHLSDGRMGGSETTNPHSDSHNPFHVSFYEKFPGPDVNGLVQASDKKKLKIGHLYEKPRENRGSENNMSDDLAFRKSSFTVSSC